MKRILAVLALLGLAACGSDTLVVGPEPSPSPSPSPAPIVHILVSVSIKPQGGGSATSSFRAGEEMKLEGSLDAVTEAGVIIVPPPVAEWRWANFSDVQARCQVFGEVNSSHPHAQCDAPGTFVVEATAIGFDGGNLGISPLLTAVVY